MQKVAALMRAEAMQGRKFRIEGHTDSLRTDPTGPYYTNWELSTARALNILHAISDYAQEVENQCQVAGFAETVPLADNDSPEGRAYNRRVDIVLLAEGHL